MKKEKVWKVGYDDGVYSEVDIFPGVEFKTLKDAKKYLASYLKNNPDEKSENYFLCKRQS